MGFAATGVVHSATGDGTMAFGHDGDGRALLRFNIEDDDKAITGSLVFAAEDHHDRFPDVVVTLGNIEQASFGVSFVKFSGPGRLHDDPVTVTVQAYDKEKAADRFVIKCVNPRGTTVFEADGELFRGDIRIGGK